MALAVAVCTAMAFTPVKNKKSKKQTVVPATLIQPSVKLVSPADSLSYAAGIATTRGLLEYVQKQLGVDTAYMADFVAGYKDAMGKGKDPRFVARNAGARIAEMVEGRILPQAQEDFKGTEHPVDSALFNAGFVAAITGDSTLMSFDHGVKLFTTTHESDKKKRDEAYKKTNEEWLAANAKKEGVKTTPSGLQYKVITEGKGERPQKTDEVTVKYEGKLIDGTEFDSSYKRNPQTTTFRADQVIKGWTEALTMMPVGSKWELYIPQNLAYGERQAGKIKPYSALIFTVELVSTKKVETPKASDKVAKDVKKFNSMKSAAKRKTSKSKK